MFGGNGMTKYIFGEQCDHGQLKRSCELCELQSENGLLREQVSDLEKENAELRKKADQIGK